MKSKKKNREKKLSILLLLIIIFTIVGYECIRVNRYKERDNAYVIRVIDGDTILVDLNGGEHRVRLLGVNTPELKYETGQESSDLSQLDGKEAYNYTKSRLEGKTVQLEYDAVRYDKYGRTLAYVYESGKMFNEEILEKNIAKYNNYGHRIKYRLKLYYAYLKR